MIERLWVRSQFTTFFREPAVLKFVHCQRICSFSLSRITKVFYSSPWALFLSVFAQVTYFRQRSCYLFLRDDNDTVQLFRAETTAAAISVLRQKQTFGTFEHNLTWQIYWGSSNKTNLTQLFCCLMTSGCCLLEFLFL